MIAAGLSASLSDQLLVCIQYSKSTQCNWHLPCRAKLENVVVVGSNKCVWVQLDSECCEFDSPKDRDPGSYNGD